MWINYLDLINLKVNKIMSEWMIKCLNIKKFKNNKRDTEFGIGDWGIK